jgi:hypothetical protein
MYTWHDVEKKMEIWNTKTVKEGAILSRFEKPPLLFFCYSPLVFRLSFSVSLQLPQFSMLSVILKAELYVSTDVFHDWVVFSPLGKRSVLLAGQVLRCGSLEIG